MVKFHVICPQCGVSVITSRLESLVWERCPGCRRHIWDRYDALMADVVPDESSRVRGRNVRINN
jgi:Zn-finger nucleic acid-binding protein